MSIGTVTIEVSPQTAAVLQHLESQAQARHLSFDAYLQGLAEQAGETTKPQNMPETAHQPIAQKIDLLHEFVAGLDHNSPLLSDEAISRESIYAHESER